MRPSGAPSCATRRGGSPASRGTLPAPGVSGDREGPGGDHRGRAMWPETPPVRGEGWRL
jgi:hypothetical protein